MARVILVEGPDGTGKTTLCNTIADSFCGKVEYIHLSKTDKVNKLYIDLINHIVASDQDLIIIDRAYISNIVYANVFHDSNTIAPHLLSQIRKLIDTTVFCLPFDKDQYLNEFNKLKDTRQEMYLDMSKVYDGFKFLYDCYSSMIEVLRYDRFTTTAKEFCNDYFPQRRL